MSEQKPGGATVGCSALLGQPVQDDGGLTELVARCAFAVLAGHSTVTISAFGKRPKGFPRGELMSIGANGSHNYAVSPIKVLAWIHERKTTPPNAVAQPRLAPEENCDGTN